MSQNTTIQTPQDYVNYTFNIEARGIAEVSGELVGLSNTITNILGQIAFKTSEFLSHTEMLAIGAGAAVSATFVKATQDAIHFQQQVANVKAIGGEAIDAKLIGSKAMEYSDKFGMATSSMTEGLEALARAGITTTNVMAGVLEEGVKLSKLEGMDLEDSINDLISTTNLLSQEDINMNAPEYAEKLKQMNQHIVSTSESAPINAQNIIQTLQHVGGYASASGMDQDDLFAVIAQLGSRGTKGEMAGTALRAFIAAGQKDTAQRALARIGLNVSDLWNDDGETMLSISEMKDVLDKALEARGYSKQEKLEFYSDFAGYKQANQIMKIDTSEVQQYKESIANAWDLGKKLDTILGTVRGNLDRIWQITQNFMTRVGGKMLSIMGAILTPVRMALELFTKIPFADTGTAILMLFVGFRTGLAIFNKIVPALGGFISRSREGKEYAKGIRGEWEQTVDQMKLASRILNNITDRKELTKIHYETQGLSAKDKALIEDRIAGQMYMKSEMYEEYGIAWNEADEPFRRMIVAELKTTDEFERNYKEYIRRTREAAAKITDNPIIITDYEYTDDLKAINKYVQHIFNLLEGDTTESDNNGNHSNNNHSDDGNRGRNRRKRDLHDIGESILNNSSQYGDYHWKSSIDEMLDPVESFDLKKLEDLQDKINEDIEKKIRDYRNFSSTSLNATGRARVAKSLTRTAMSPFGIAFSTYANTSDIRHYLETGERRSGGQLFTEEQLIKAAEALNIHFGANDVPTAEVIYNAYQSRRANDPALLDKISDATQKVWFDKQKNRTDVSYFPTRALERHQDVANQLMTLVGADSIAGVQSYFAGNYDENILKEATKIMADNHAFMDEVVEAEITYMYENLARVQNTIEKISQEGLHSHSNKGIDTDQVIAAYDRLKNEDYYLQSYGFHTIGKPSETGYRFMKLRDSDWLHINTQDYTGGIMGEDDGHGRVAINPGVIKYHTDNYGMDYGDNYGISLLENLVHEMGHVLSDHSVRETQAYKDFTGEGIDDITLPYDRLGYRDGFVAEYEANYIAIKTLERLGLEASSMAYQRMNAFKKIIDDNQLQGVNLELADSIVDTLVFNRKMLADTVTHLSTQFDMVAANTNKTEVYESLRPVLTALQNRTRSTAFYDNKEFKRNKDNFDKIISDMAIDILSLNPASTGDNEGILKQAIIGKYAPLVGIHNAQLAYEYAASSATPEAIDGFKKAMLKDFNENDYIKPELNPDFVGEENEDIINRWRNRYIKKYLSELEQSDIQDDKLFLYYDNKEGVKAYNGLIHSHSDRMKNYLEIGASGYHVIEQIDYLNHEGLWDTKDVNIKNAIFNLKNFFAETSGAFANQVLFHGGQLNTNEHGFGQFNLRSLTYEEDIATRHSRSKDRYKQTIYVPTDTPLILPTYEMLGHSWYASEQEATIGIGQPYLEIKRDLKENDDGPKKAEVILLGPNQQNQFLSSIGLQGHFNTGGNDTNSFYFSQLIGLRDKAIEENKVAFAKDLQNLIDKYLDTGNELALINTIKNKKDRDRARKALETVNVNNDITKPIFDSWIYFKLGEGKQQGKISIDTFYDYMEKTYGKETATAAKMWIEDASKNTDNLLAYNGTGMSMNIQNIPDIMIKWHDLKKQFAYYDIIDLPSGEKIKLPVHKQFEQYGYTRDADGNLVTKFAQKYMHKHSSNDPRAFEGIVDILDSDKIRKLSREDQEFLWKAILKGENRDMYDVIMKKQFDNPIFQQLMDSDGKLGEGWAALNITTAMDCMGRLEDGTCDFCDACYAFGQAAMLPEQAVKQVAKSVLFANTSVKEFVDILEKQNVKVVRFNQEGDFRRKEDYDKTEQIAKLAHERGLETKFYGYTKNKEVLEHIRANGTPVNYQMQDSLDESDPKKHGVANYRAASWDDMLQSLKDGYRLCAGACEGCEQCLKNFNKVTILRDGSDRTGLGVGVITKHLGGYHDEHSHRKHIEFFTAAQRYEQETGKRISFQGDDYVGKKFLQQIAQGATADDVMQNYYKEKAEKEAQNQKTSADLKGHQNKGEDELSKPTNLNSHYAKGRTSNIGQSFFDKFASVTTMSLSHAQELYDALQTLYPQIDNELLKDLIVPIDEDNYWKHPIKNANIDTAAERYQLLDRTISSDKNDPLGLLKFLKTNEKLTLEDIYQAVADDNRFMHIPFDLTGEFIQSLLDNNLITEEDIKPSYWAEKKFAFSGSLRDQLKKTQSMAVWNLNNNDFVDKIYDKWASDNELKYTEDRLPDLDDVDYTFKGKDSRYRGLSINDAYTQAHLDNRFKDRTGVGGFGYGSLGKNVHQFMQDWRTTELDAINEKNEYKALYKNKSTTPLGVLRGQSPIKNNVTSVTGRVKEYGIYINNLNSSAGDIRQIVNLKNKRATEYAYKHGYVTKNQLKQWLKLNDELSYTMEDVAQWDIDEALESSFKPSNLIREVRHLEINARNILNRIKKEGMLSEYVPFKYPIKDISPLSILQSLTTPVQTTLDDFITTQAETQNKAVEWGMPGLMPSVKWGLHNAQQVFFKNPLKDDSRTKKQNELIKQFYEALDTENWDELDKILTQLTFIDKAFDSYHIALKAFNNIDDILEIKNIPKKQRIIPNLYNYNAIAFTDAFSNHKQPLIEKMKQNAHKEELLRQAKQDKTEDTTQTHNAPFVMTQQIRDFINSQKTTSNTAADQSRIKREKENQFNIRWLFNSLVLTRGQRGVIQKLLMKGDNQAIVQEIKRSNAQVSDSDAKLVADHLMNNPKDLDLIREDLFKTYQSDEDLRQNKNAHIPITDAKESLHKSIYDSHYMSNDEAKARYEENQRIKRERAENKRENARQKLESAKEPLTSINWGRIKFDDDYFYEIIASDIAPVNKVLADSIREWGTLQDSVKIWYGGDVQQFYKDFMETFVTMGEGFAIIKNKYAHSIYRSRAFKKMSPEAVEQQEKEQAQATADIFSALRMFDHADVLSSLATDISVWEKTGDQINIVTSYLGYFAGILEKIGEIIPGLNIVLTPLQMAIEKTAKAGNLVKDIGYTRQVIKLLHNPSQMTAEEAKRFGLEKQWEDAQIFKMVFGDHKQFYKLLDEVAGDFTQYFRVFRDKAIDTAKYGIKFFIKYMKILGPIAAAVAIAIGGLWLSERNHAKALKETQENIEEYNKKTLGSLATYRDLNEQRKNEVDVIKRQQLAIREATALYELEANGAQKLINVNKQSQLKSDNLWGEYGARAGWQRFTHGHNLMSGEFKTQYQDYDGITKNIRQIREEVVGNLFATKSQKEVAAFYDRNVILFGEVEAYSKELGKLYDKESQLIDEYGSIEAARETDEFNKAVQEFSDATRINGKTAVQMLDWLETENRVDKATQAMQLYVNMIVAEATRNAFAELYPDRDFSDARGIEDAMIYAQSDQLIKDAYDQLWWEAFGNMLWGYFNVIIGILNPADWVGEILGWEDNRMDLADRHFKAAEAYTKGQEELIENQNEMLRLGKDAAENADRRDYGAKSLSNYNDMPFGFAIENAILMEAEGVQKGIDDIYDIMSIGMQKAGEEGVSSFKDGLNQHSPGDISNSIFDEMIYSQMFIDELTPSLANSFTVLGQKEVIEHNQGLGKDGNGPGLIPYHTQQELEYTQKILDENKEPIGQKSYDIGYETGQQYGNGFRDGLKDLYEQVSTPEAMNDTLKQTFLYDQGIQKPTNDETVETVVESAGDAASMLFPKVIKEVIEKVAKKILISTGKTAVKGSSKTLDELIPFIGPMITAGFAIAEHNPFETHYNEDGSEKRALQSTGEVVGEVAGAVAAMALGNVTKGAVLVATGNPILAAIAGTGVEIISSLVLEPIGKAIGGTIGWVADEIVNTPLKDAWNGFNDALGGIPGQIYDFIDQSPIGDLGHWAFNQLDNLTGGWLSNTWDYISNSSIASMAGDTWSWLSGAAGNTWNWLSGAAGNTWNWLSGAAGNTWDWLSGAAGNTWNWLSNGNRQANMQLPLDMQITTQYTQQDMPVNEDGSFLSKIMQNRDAFNKFLYEFIEGRKDPLMMLFYLGRNMGLWGDNGILGDNQVDYDLEDMSNIAHSNYATNLKNDMFSSKEKNIPVDSSKNTVIIKNININTEDDPEKIKTAFMNLMIELEEQITPKQVSRTIGAPSNQSTTQQDNTENDQTNTDVNTDTNNNNPTI